MVRDSSGVGGQGTPIVLSIGCWQGFTMDHWSSLSAYHSGEESIQVLLKSRVKNGVFLMLESVLPNVLSLFTINYHFPLTDYEKKWLPQVIMCTGRNSHCFLNITSNMFKWFTVPCNWFSENMNILLPLWQLSTASIILTLCRTWLMSFIFCSV